VHLIQDEFAECIDNLERGIQINALYPTLSKDMQMFAEKARQAMLGQSQVSTPDVGSPSEPASASRSADLSAYRTDSDD
jgi:hypothetical protein